MTKELIGVQYLRGIAAMLVVLHHLCFEHTQLGPYAVQMFFVISGFVMWYATVLTKMSVTSFWLRRVVRIVPLYWLFLSILVIVAAFMPRWLNSTVLTPEAIVKSYFFIPYYNTSQNSIAPLLVPGWSLNYEMFFYFVFGLFLFVKPDALRLICLGALLWCLVLIGQWFRPEFPPAATYTNPNLLLFFNGIMLAVVYRAYKADSPMLGMILALAGVLLASFSVPGNLGAFERFIGVSPALIVAGILSLETTLRRLPSPLLHTIGNASYSIYLSHLFFLRLSELGWRSFTTIGSSQTSQVSYVIFSFIFAIAGGIAVYYLIERPMLTAFLQPKFSKSTRPA
jgi:exopolysaccharide production protein ExoZ